MPASPVTSRCHRYPAELMAPCVRLYVRLPLSDRTVEDLLVARRACFVRDSPPLTPQARAGDRRRTQASPAMPEREVASRRGLHHDERDNV